MHSVYSHSDIDIDIDIDIAELVAYAETLRRMDNFRSLSYSASASVGDACAQLTVHTSDG